MNVLWITYAPIGKNAEVLHGIQKQGGSWVDASAACLLKECPDLSLTILAVGSGDKEGTDPETGIRYAEYSGVQKCRGARKKDDTEKWTEVLKKYPCELIELFGTEFSNGLDIVEAADGLGIPVVIYMQGVVSSFIGHEFGHFSRRELNRGASVLDRFKALRYRKDYLDYVRQAPFEREMVAKSRGVIVDNRWCVKSLGLQPDDPKVLRQNLPVSGTFLSGRWEAGAAERHSVFTVAGRTPYKGLHILLKALLTVREAYPDVKLRIPGQMDSRSALQQPPYVDYIARFIRENGLEKNIEFLGRLDSEGMKQNILRCNAYVMPSCIENHSSSLREAMYLGAPCITSEVGSITEMTVNGHNALTYRYGEHIQLAMDIIEIFRDDALAAELGKNAYTDIRNAYPQDVIGRQLLEAYRQILSGQPCGGLRRRGTENSADNPPQEHAERPERTESEE